MKEFLKTVFEVISFLLIIIFVSALVLWAIYIVIDKYASYDDSDGPDKRSGFTVMTDYKTGLQYLKSGHALTPRLDRNGKQIIKDGK